MFEVIEIDAQGNEGAVVHSGFRTWIDAAHWAQDHRIFRGEGVTLHVRKID